MASLGPGVIILIIIWVLAIATLTLFTFVQSPIRFVGIAALIIAIIVTLVLGLLPRGTVDASAELLKTPTNPVGLARILILTALCVTFLIGLGVVFVQEVVPPIYAQSVRKRFVR